jgi:hypothetical protein
LFFSYMHIAHCAVMFKAAALTSVWVSIWHFTLKPARDLFTLRASAVMEVNQATAWSIRFYELFVMKFWFFLISCSCHDY